MTTSAGAGVSSPQGISWSQLRFWKLKRPISKIGLDKSGKMCYNTDTKKRKEMSEMITTKSKEECFQGWAKMGLAALEYLKSHPNDYKANVYVRTAAACCAELDRKHKREETQILQSYVWEQGYLSGEDSYERYEQSGYFKEEYRKVA